MIYRDNMFLKEKLRVIRNIQQLKGSNGPHLRYKKDDVSARSRDQV